MPPFLTNGQKNYRLQNDVLFDVYLCFHVYFEVKVDLIFYIVDWYQEYFCYGVQSLFQDMFNQIYLMKVAILLILLVVSSTQIEITSTYTTTSTASDKNTQRYPLFPLGQLSQGQTLTLNFKLPTLQTAQYLNGKIQLYDESLNVLSPPVIFPNLAGPTASVSVVVPATQSYRLKIIADNIPYLAVYQFEVEVNGVVRHRYVDVFRYYTVKYIYLSAAKPFSMKISGISPSYGAAFVTLIAYKMKDSSPLQREGPPQAFSGSGYASNGEVTISNALVGPGYYTLQLAYPIVAGQTITFVYNTDEYTVPFDSCFNDYSQVFIPASHLCFVQCPARTYESRPMTCSACLFDCYECTNGQACSSCDATNDHRQMNPYTSRCLPLPGYYETGVSVAGACQVGCIGCTSPTNCHTCDHKHYFQKDGRCIQKCQTDRNPPCKQCPDDCLTCNIFGHCTSCEDHLVLNPNSKRCQNTPKDGLNLQRGRGPAYPYPPN